MIQPTEAEIETADILVLSCSGNRLVHGRYCFAEASEIGLEYGHVKQSILIVALVSCMCRIVEVAMQILKSTGIVTCSPGFKETGRRVVSFGLEIFEASQITVRNVPNSAS